MSLRSQQEISEILEVITGGVSPILSATMKKAETLRDMVHRLWRVEGITPGEASRVAAKRGHKISAGYISDLESGIADNPSPKLLRALAAGFGLPLDYVIAVAFGLEAPIEFGDRFFAEMSEEFALLSPAKQKEKRYLLEVIHREIRRDL